MREADKSVTTDAKDALGRDGVIESTRRELQNTVVVNAPEVHQPMGPGFHEKTRARIVATEFGLWPFPYLRPCEVTPS